MQPPLKVTKTDTASNEYFTLVTLSFSVIGEDGTTGSGSIDVQLEGQDYSEQQIETLAVDRAYRFLQLIVAAHPDENILPEPEQ